MPKTLTRITLGLALAAIQPGAQAAGLGLVPGYPDITTDYSEVIYDYTAGVGGTLTIDGTLTGNGVGQTIQLTPGGPFYYILDPSNPGDPFNTGYSLTATFNSAGQFTGGSVTVTGKVVTDTDFFADGDLFDDLHPDYSSGTLLTATLTDFGFVGLPIPGSKDQLLLEFLITTTGGDLFTAGFNYGGVIWNGQVIPTFGMDWDLGGLSAFQRNFASCSGCGATLNTFVPLPAAPWLFGAGLTGLATLARRRRTRVREELTA